MCSPGDPALIFDNDKQCLLMWLQQNYFSPGGFSGTFSSGIGIHEIEENVDDSLHSLHSRPTHPIGGIKILKYSMA